MDFIIQNKEQKRRLFDFMADKIYRGSDFKVIKYLSLYNMCIRVIAFTPEVLTSMKQQLSYVLKDEAEHYDATIVVFKEPHTETFLAEASDTFDIRKNRLFRVYMLFRKYAFLNIATDNRMQSVFINVDSYAGLITAFDEENRTVYYGVRDFTPEEFIKHGHVFIKALYRLNSLPNRHLVHGAAVGVNGVGALLCARGQRGKSTLTVNALLNGFDYVADDYLLLDKENGELFASPIYSIITLNPKMYQKMYDDFKGKFVSTNARFDKYVFNMAAYHAQFREHYPIKVCLFPNICADKEPSIIPMNKGRGIAEMIHSTINQTNDDYNTQTVKKLLDFLKPFEFYQINLCIDITKNTQCLYDFLTTYTRK